MIEPPELDDEQKSVVDEVINSRYSSVLIALPGAGKTRTAISVAYHSPDSRVLVTTLTKQAAKEVKERAPWVEANNIHSFCFRYLRSRGNYRFRGEEQILYDFLELKHKPRKDLIIVDESHNLNTLVWDVVESMTKRVFAVGDPYQSIFDDFTNCIGSGFGSYLSKRFGCDKRYLTRNHRCNEKVVNELNRILPRDMKSCDEPKPNGKIAILVRYKKDYKAISALLEGGGMPHILKTAGSKYWDITTRGNSSNLYLMDTFCSIGLEFDKVYVQIWNEIHSEQRVNYVAIARAIKDFRYFINPLDIIESLVEEVNYDR